MPVAIHAAPAVDAAPDVVERWRTIPVAVAADLGREIGEIDPAIRPLRPAGHQPRLFGRAVTALCEPPDFGAVLHALDLVKPGDVLLIAASGHAETAMIGDILGGHLRQLGASGLVCDGAVRDTATLAGFTDFPVYTRWITPRGPSSADRGVVNLPVVIGGRLVSPGDVIIGDDDGLIALPPTAVMERAIRKASAARQGHYRTRLPAGLDPKDGS